MDKINYPQELLDMLQPGMTVNHKNKSLHILGVFDTNAYDGGHVAYKWHTGASWFYTIDTVYYFWLLYKKGWLKRAEPSAKP
jgi:hypothetical protein